MKLSGKDNRNNDEQFEVRCNRLTILTQLIISMGRL